MELSFFRMQQGTEAYQVMREELAEADILVEWGGTCTRTVRLRRRS